MTLISRMTSIISHAKSAEYLQKGDLGLIEYGSEHNEIHISNCRDLNWLEKVVEGSSL